MKKWKYSKKKLTGLGKPEPEPDRTIEYFQNRLYTLQKCLKNHLDAQLYLSSAKGSRTRTRTLKTEPEPEPELEL
jgi:hypothetical protein